MTRPSLVFYCQHSLGFGHLARVWTLAAALSAHFRVSVWCGGPLPEGLTPPASCDVLPLPPIVVNEDGRLLSVDGRHTVDSAFEARRETMLRLLASERPEVIVIELFPFGRRKFERELLPLLEAGRAASSRPIVVCSLRDILVARGDRQTEHDERARLLVDRYFDAVLIHADPEFARLEEFFRPRHPLRTSVHYTGFVAGTPPMPSRIGRSGILVSGGGGRFADALFMTAIDAHRCLKQQLPMTVVAGPLSGTATWERLVSAASREPLIRLVRSVPDLSAEMAAAQLSISQCGYNTALDIVRARVPALVVPFAEAGETEQTDRARRLESLGALRVLSPHLLDASALAAAIDETLEFKPSPFPLDLDGAARTTQLLKDLVDAPRQVAVGRSQ